MTNRIVKGSFNRICLVTSIPRPRRRQIIQVSWYGTPQQRVQVKSGSGPSRPIREGFVRLNGEEIPIPLTNEPDSGPLDMANWTSQ